MSNRKAEAIKHLVTIQKEKVSTAKTNPEKQDLYATKMLVADLEELNTDIFKAEQLGLTWSLETYGCTRSKLDFWRQYSIKLNEELTETKKRDDRESTFIVHAYLANVKLTKLPKITKETWPEWFMRWNQEEKYLKDEWAKFITLKGCFNEKEDIEAGKQLQHIRCSSRSTDQKTALFPTSF